MMMEESKNVVIAPFLPEDLFTITPSSEFSRTTPAQLADRYIARLLNLLAYLQIQMLRRNTLSSNSRQTVSGPANDVKRITRDS
jgi:hypothetical protein